MYFGTALSSRQNFLDPSKRSSSMIAMLQRIIRQNELIMNANTASTPVSDSSMCVNFNEPVMLANSFMQRAISGCLPDDQQKEIILDESISLGWMVSRLRSHEYIDRKMNQSACCVEYYGRGNDRNFPEIVVHLRKAKGEAWRVVAFVYPRRKEYPEATSALRFEILAYCAVFLPHYETFKAEQITTSYYHDKNSGWTMC